MPDKIIHFDRIGDVTFRKNKRSKNVSIAIRPLKGVIVNLPHYVSYGFAKNVVEKKLDWILDHLPKIEKIENKLTVFTPSTDFFTKYRKLNIISEKTDHVKTLITAEKILIKYPEHIHVKDQRIQEIIRNTITKTLRAEAKSYLPQRTKALAQQLHFKFNKVFIKNTKTLWGSCSAQNNINLNLHLMRLPDHLIDYVIIHELCHTIEKNHGRQFWELMDSILGNAKNLSKELKKYSIQIY